jgi:hypothetical protein
MNAGTKALVGVFGALNALTFVVAAATSGVGAGLLIGALGFVSAMLYFLPAIVAFERAHSNSTPIFVLDLLLGWLVIPWVVALVWALSRDRAAEILRQTSTVERVGTDVSPREPSFAPGWSASVVRASETSVPLASHAPATPTTKACPFCAEQILVAAIKCKHCGSDLSAK